MTDVIPIVDGEHRKLAIYDPEEGLKSIAVAEVAEKHFRRAKDASKLYKAIEEKIRAQAEYVVWRDSVVKHGGDRKSNSSRQNGQLDPLPGADPGHDVVKRWRKKLCTKGKVDADKVAAEAQRLSKRLATIIDGDKLGKALVDAKHRAVRICEQEKDTEVRGTGGTGEFERYTPAYFVDAARAAFGGQIDLDPASSEVAQRTVKAEEYFTTESVPDGLNRDWHGRVFLNPPYHRDLAPKFIAKLIAELESGRVTAAILLTNNSTDTDWFHAAEAACDALCFTHGRIKFTQDDGVTEVLPTQGQAFFYFGPDVDGFESVFFRIGFGVLPCWGFEKREVKHERN